MYILWLLWKNRNNCFHNQLCSVPAGLTMLATKMREDFNASMVMFNVGDTINWRPWQPLLGDQYKINVDAAYSATTKEASLGVVVRDMKAELCLSAVARLEDIVSPLQAEIKAILFGLQLVKEMNLQNIQMESDLLIAVKQISKRDEFYCEWDGLLSDILELSLDFNSCFFRHISRTSNTLAHNISKVQSDVGEHKIWEVFYLLVYVILMFIFLNESCLNVFYKKEKKKLCWSNDLTQKITTT